MTKRNVDGMRIYNYLTDDKRNAYGYLAVFTVSLIIITLAVHNVGVLADIIIANY